ncbi:hypothetical protein RH831_09345 [Halodesulfurarchaeum sp. HSR-GB]|uniref:hypothetical protein n=1 Tax=Halodesulfurarchaeum sp. HSR-GB TaxID=3074077 RepID=UPI00285F4445|nr:hypothetical protein [Halodesulfurarchaeum sp. HSR-GB]MDR5657383.1 hypothetical protein [Halodesulfurarchaeum sp. HSR-GB]
MSDARNGTPALGRLAIRSARLEAMRERMDSFVHEQDVHESLSTLRKRTVTDVPLSEQVDRDRDERIE